MSTRTLREMERYVQTQLRKAGVHANIATLEGKLQVGFLLLNKGKVENRVIHQRSYS